MRNDIIEARSPRRHIDAGNPSTEPSERKLNNTDCLRLQPSHVDAAFAASSLPSTPSTEEGGPSVLHREPGAAEIHELAAELRRLQIRQEQILVELAESIPGSDRHS